MGDQKLFKSAGASDRDNNGILGEVTMARERVCESKGDGM